MTVAELITILQTFDPGATVMTKGYEYGWGRLSLLAIRRADTMIANWGCYYENEEDTPKLNNVVLIDRDHIEEDDTGYGAKWFVDC